MFELIKYLAGSLFCIFLFIYNFKNSKGFQFIFGNILFVIAFIIFFGQFISRL